MIRNFFMTVWTERSLAVSIKKICGLCQLPSSIRTASTRMSCPFRASIYPMVRHLNLLFIARFHPYIGDGGSPDRSVERGSHADGGGGSNDAFRTLYRVRRRGNGGVSHRGKGRSTPYKKSDISTSGRYFLIARLGTGPTDTIRKFF